eukprot:gene2061-2541_t
MNNYSLKFLFVNFLIVLLFVNFGDSAFLQISYFKSQGCSGAPFSKQWVLLDRCVKATVYKYNSSAPSTGNPVTTSTTSNPQSTSGNPQTTTGNNNPQSTTSGTPQSTSGNPQTTTGNNNPQSTSGNPQSTSGNPQSTSGNPQSSSGIPQTTNTEQSSTSNRLTLSTGNNPFTTSPLSTQSTNSITSLITTNNNGGFAPRDIEETFDSKTGTITQYFCLDASCGNLNNCFVVESLTLGTCTTSASDYVIYSMVDVIGYQNLTDPNVTRANPKGLCYSYSTENACLDQNYIEATEYSNDFCARGYKYNCSNTFYNSYTCTGIDCNFCTLKNSYELNVCSVTSSVGTLYRSFIPVQQTPSPTPSQPNDVTTSKPNSTSTTTTTTTTGSSSSSSATSTIIQIHHLFSAFILIIFLI